MKVESAKYEKTMSGSLRSIERAAISGDLTRSVCEFSSSSMVPLYAVYLYFMDVMGEKKELVDGFISICKFYGYREVLDFNNKIRWLQEPNEEGQYFSKSS
jgi:hypothetical protein